MGELSPAALLREWRCAQCWGALVERFTQGAYAVVCPKGCTPGGFVTARYVDEARAQSAADAVEVALAYPDLAAGVIPTGEEAARLKRDLFGEV